MTRALKKSPGLRAAMSGALTFPPTAVYPTDGYMAFTQTPAGQFDPRSFRTKRIGKRGTLATVGCPPGAWDPSAKRCAKGMRMQRVMVPKGRAMAMMRRGMTSSTLVPNNYITPGGASVLVDPAMAGMVNPSVPISATKTRKGLEISAIIDGHLVRRWYQSYSKRDAIRLFKQEVMQTKSRIGNPSLIERQFPMGKVLAPVLADILALSSVTISTLTGLRNYLEIDSFQIQFFKKAKELVRQGRLHPTATWQEAWEKVGHVQFTGYSSNPPLLTIWPAVGNPLPDGSHRKAGSFDKASRWYPDSEYQVPGSFNVRGPSRAWPFSYLKHFYTDKYMKMLAQQRPDLFARLVQNPALPGPAYPTARAAMSPSAMANPGIPFRAGQEINISDFEAWLSSQPPKIKSAYKKAMRQYIKFHLGSKPKSISFQMLDIGGPQMMPPEVLFSAGPSPAETYTPEKHSKKAPHSYVHEYESQPPVLVGGSKGKQFVLKPLSRGAKVDDWFRG